MAVVELEIVHLYHDLLNTYGDDGNIKIIKSRAEKRGIEVKVHNVTLGDKIEKCDLLFLGGGQDFEQTIASNDLVNNRCDFMKSYVEDGGTALCICGGYQLMGEYYVAADGKKMPGLSVLPIKTEAGNKRLIGNLVLENELELLVGFENHSGRTYTGDLAPLGRVLYGHGNNGEDKKEGAVYKNTVCTYMHGPFLSKNPAICDDLIKRALERRYGKAELSPIEEGYAEAAKNVMLKRLLKEDGAK